MVLLPWLWKARAMCLWLMRLTIASAWCLHLGSSARLLVMGQLPLQTELARVLHSIRPVVWLWETQAPCTWVTASTTASA